MTAALTAAIVFLTVFLVGVYLVGGVGWVMVVGGFGGLVASLIVEIE